jgi:hypothetical protein
VTFLDIVGKKMNLSKGTMEMTLVDLVHHTIQPRAVVFLPIVALLKIVHKILMHLIVF